MLEQNLKKAMDTRLSGLRITPRQREILLRQMRGERIMKKKMTLGLALVLILMLLMAAAAIALGGNLFAVFSKDDPALGYIADHAATVAPSSTPEAQGADDQPVTTDSVYFDGMSLYVSYRIKGGNTCIQAYTPTAEELKSMQQESNVPVPAISEESEVLAAFAKSVGEGVAAGYHSRSMARSDGISTADGVDIPWYTDKTAAQGDDLICYVQFASPLPSAIAESDAFTMQMTFFQSDLYVWFDGHTLYSKSIQGKRVTVPVDILRNNSSSELRLSGQVDMKGETFLISAAMTPVSISLSYPQIDGLEFALFDPATGEEAESTSVEPLKDGTVLQTFAGFGRMPQALSACPITYEYPYPGNMETQNIVYQKEQAVMLRP